MGLSVACGFIGGVSGALLMMSHPGAWPHQAIASAMWHAGYASATTPFLRAGIGGAITGGAALIAGLWLEEKVKKSQRRAAIRRTDREAREDGAIREQMQGANKSTAGGLAAVIAEPEPNSNRATPLFIFGCVAAAFTVLLTYAYFF